MESKLIFYPVGNGDTSQIILPNGRRILFDFCHRRQGENDESEVIDLKNTLKAELEQENRNYFDVVAFTHGDEDHIANSTEFFELKHAKKYQGGERIKINELWVPAAMILESATSTQQSSEMVILRQEARFRLKEGKGIQVFSKPEKLKEWLENEGLNIESRRHLITDAGQLAKGFSYSNDNVEFFCHSPFIKHVDEGTELRNEAALIFQVRFKFSGVETNFFAIGDSTYDVMEDIITISKKKHNEDRLKWDILNIPHHCSAYALSPEKGDAETVPTKKIEEFLLQGQTDSYLISSSNPIRDNEEAYKQKLPPHIQAKKAYEQYLKKVNGRKFLVTMEEPDENQPKPLEFQISNLGFRLISQRASGSSRLIQSKVPRAG